MEWTEDTTTRLTELWEDHQPASAIARDIGKSRSAVLGKAHRENLATRPRSAGPPLPERKRAAPGQSSVVRAWRESVNPSWGNGDSLGELEPDAVPEDRPVPNRIRRPRPLWDRPSDGCKWIVTTGDKNPAGFALMCCEPREYPDNETKPYCACHAARARVHL